MKLEIFHKGFELSKDIKRHIRKKFGKLDKLTSRSKRSSVHAEVKLKEEAGKKKQKVTAEVILKVPGATLTAKEANDNVFAAIDRIEAKIKRQLRDYKDKNTKKQQGGRRAFKRLRRLKEFDFRRRD